MWTGCLGILNFFRYSQRHYIYIYIKWCSRTCSDNRSHSLCYSATESSLINFQDFFQDKKSFLIGLDGLTEMTSLFSFSEVPLFPYRLCTQKEGFRIYCLKFRGHKRMRAVVSTTLGMFIFFFLNVNEIVFWIESKND